MGLRLKKTSRQTSALSSPMMRSDVLRSEAFQFSRIGWVETKRKVELGATLVWPMCCYACSVLQFTCCSGWVLKKLVDPTRETYYLSFYSDGNCQRNWSKSDLLDLSQEALTS